MATKTKAPKLTIKNKAPGKFLTGMNTQILIDGKPVRGVRSFKLEVDARKMALLTLEMYVDVGPEDKAK